jgi:hypothetical protein
MDPTKPHGEACTLDGGLKEAHEIDWVNDPDDLTPMTNRKRAGMSIALLILTLIRWECPVSAA